MNAPLIVACAKCGQKLGIQGDSGPVHVTCPKCAAEWDWPAKASSETGARARVTHPSEETDRARRTCPSEESNAAAGEQATPSRGRAGGGSWFSFSFKKPRVSTLALLGLGLFVAFRVAGCLLTYTPPKPLPAAEANAALSKRAIWNVPPEQPLPDNGHGVFEFDPSVADSMLRVNPRGEQGHIVLKVQNSADDRFVCWLFIRHGQTAETRIPAGAYRLKLACGEKWYGETDPFGPGGSHSAIVNEIKIPTNTVYTVDLHPSAGGTLRERRLRAEDF